MVLTWPGSKGARVADFWLDGNWDFRFRTPFNDWELVTVKREEIKLEGYIDFLLNCV